MNIAIISLGCPKNQVDADVFCHALIKAGHQTVADPEQADIIIVNTCGFIQSAKEEAIENILMACQYKQQNPNLKGGMEVSRIDPEKLMSLYSIVFQDVTLFDNTILENIRLGRKGATDEEVLAAAKLANCEEFAEKLPDKWNTNIGENGCALSGGERQRISIARAFLKDAPIILLDEATASLDVENETAIQEALSRLIKNKTVLIIAHRMRTVAGADQVVVLSGGIVAEQGSPAELYARKGLYTHMVDLQSASQNWTI